MAIQAGPTRSGRPSAPQRPTRGPGETVTMRTTTALAPILTGIALAQEVLASAETMQTAAAVGSRQIVAHSAGRLGYRATKALAEFRAFAALIEPR